MLLSGPISALTHRFAVKKSLKEIEELIRLNYNEHPWGPSSNARAAIIESMDKANRYPDEQVDALKKKIGERQVFTYKQILCLFF